MLRASFRWPAWPWEHHPTRITHVPSLTARTRVLTLLAASTSKGDLHKVGMWWRALEQVRAEEGGEMKLLHSAGLEAILQTHLFAGEGRRPRG